MGDVIPKKGFFKNLLQIKIQEEAIIQMAKRLSKMNYLINKLGQGQDADQFTIEDEDQLKLIFEIFLKKEKSKTDTQILINFLYTMKGFVGKLKEVFHNENKLVTELLQALSHSLNCEKVEKDSLLFKLGDKGEKFYIILSGEVDILIPKEKRIRTSEYDYLNYLAILKKYEEYELLSKCLIANKYAVSNKVESEDTNNLEKMKIQSTIRNNSNQHGNNLNRKATMKNALMRKFSINAIEEMTIKIMNSTNLNQEDINRLFCNDLDEKSLTQICSQDYIDRLKICKDYSMMSNSELENINSEIRGKLIYVCIFDYHKVLTLKTGQTFGEVALDNPNQKRSASIITNNETYFGTINKDIYSKSIKDVNDKVKKTNLNFILSNELFLDVNKVTFEKKFFNLFVNTKIERGEKIVIENEYITNLCFIREGEYDVFLHKSLFELTEIIQDWDRSYHKDKYFGKLENIRCYNDKDFKKFYHMKRKIRVFIIKGKELIGLEDFFEKFKSAFSIECTSARGEIFKLEKNFFDIICGNVKCVEEKVESVKIKKKSFLLEKFIKIRETKLNTYCQKDDKEKVNDIFSHEIKNEKSYDNFRNIKVLFSNRINRDKNKESLLINEKNNKNISQNYKTNFKDIKVLDLKMETMIHLNSENKFNILEENVTDDDILMNEIASPYLRGSDHFIKFSLNSSNKKNIDSNYVSPTNKNTNQIINTFGQNIRQSNQNSNIKNNNNYSPKKNVNNLIIIPISEPLSIISSAFQTPKLQNKNLNKSEENYELKNIKYNSSLNDIFKSKIDKFRNVIPNIRSYNFRNDNKNKSNTINYYSLSNNTSNVNIINKSKIPKYIVNKRSRLFHSETKQIQFHNSNREYYNYSPMKFFSLELIKNKRKEKYLKAKEKIKLVRTDHNMFRFTQKN